MIKILNTLLFLLLISCTNKDKASTYLNKIDLKNASMTKELLFTEEIDSIEYILLEMTEDGSSAINNILDLCITDDYIYIQSSKRDGILQFRRDGKFIQTFAEKGYGPEETHSINSISADEKNKILYISQLSNTLLFSFNGNYIRKINTPRMTSCQYYLDENLLIEVGKLFTPLNTSDMFGLGIFNLKGDTIGIRNNFINTKILPAEETGLTSTYLIPGISNNYLSHISLSDTIYSLSDEGIVAVYEIYTNNTIEAKKELMHFRSANNFPVNDYMILDFFETYNYFYIRSLHKEQIYIYSYNKYTKKTFSVCAKENPFDFVRYNRRLSLIGLQNPIKKSIPIWISKVYWEKKILVQFNTASELLYLKENNLINSTIKEISEIKEDSNPLISIYHLK